MLLGAAVLLVAIVIFSGKNNNTSKKSGGSNKLLRDSDETRYYNENFTKVSHFLGHLKNIMDKFK